MKFIVTKKATEIGISQGFLSNILCGRRRPHYKTAKKIAKATNTNPILWLEGTPEQIRQAISDKEEAA